MCIRDRFQAQLCHSTAAVAQNFALVAVVTQSVLQQAELGNGHVGDEDGMGPVSYTHLDVYKRQPRKRSLPLTVPRRARRGAE